MKREIIWKVKKGIEESDGDYDRESKWEKKKKKTTESEICNDRIKSIQSKCGKEREEKKREREDKNEEKQKKVKRIIECRDICREMKKVKEIAVKVKWTK